MTRTLRAVLGVLALMMLSRGVDYSTGNSFDMGPQWGEHLDQPVLWGNACLLLAAASAIGAICGNALVAKWVGFFGFGINLMFAIQIYDYRMWPYPWPPEDSRIITDHIGHALIYLIISCCVWWRVGVERKKQELIAESR